MSSTTSTSAAPSRQCYWIPPVIPGALPLLRVRERPKYVPAGYRIAPNGFDLELVANPNWPTQPFNRFCTGRTMPNEALLFEARVIMPEFDPEKDPLAWPTLEAFIRTWAGRSDEQLAQMSQEDVTATLRAYSLQKQIILRCDTPTGRSKSQPAAKHDGSGQPPQKKARVNERLIAFAATNRRDAIELSLDDLGARIGCKKGAFSRSAFYQETLKPLREKPSRRGRAGECLGAEDKQAMRDYDAANDEREAIDRRLDAEAPRSRR